MRKTLLVATAIMAAMAISCEKTPTGPVGEPSEYIVEAYGPSEVLDIAREVSKTVKVAAVTGNKGVAAQLTVTFKVDGSLVSEYNAGQPADRQASLLPAECYTITDNGCTIYPCSQQSTSAKITLRWCYPILYKIFCYTIHIIPPSIQYHYHIELFL